MKALLRPAFVGVLSIAMAAMSLVGSSSLALAVPPPLVPKWSLELPVYEGADVFLNGTFTGGDGNGPYTVEVYWNGDAPGNTSEMYSFATLPTRNPCSPDLLQLCWVVRVQKAAPYVNDQPTPISIVVFLDDGSRTNRSVLDPLTISNAAPTFGSFGLSATDIEAGQSVTATGQFADNGTNDTHTVRVAWDDGSPVTEFVLPVGARTFTTDAHKYDLVRSYTVSATVTDDAGAWDGKTATLSVHAANQAPTMSFDVTAGPEGGDSTLALTFADPDALDTHTVTIVWGDGMTTDSGDLAPDVTTFNPKHVYADTGSYRVDLTLTDSATPAHLVTDTKTVVVTNVDPVLGSLQLTPSSVVDHQEVTLSASFTDPGTLDTFTLTVDWGAGAMPPQPLGTDRTFSVKHAYDAAGPVTITATVEDRDGGKSSQSVNLVVLPSNHAPTGLLFDATPTGANVVVTGSFVDPDTTDTHTLALTWGDGLSTTQELAAGETTFNAPHVYATSNTYTVTATVTDHPADASTSPVSKQVVVTVPAETASDLIDQMSSAVRSFGLDRNAERWLLKKLDDLRDSLIYGNDQVCSSTGTLSHVLAFAERTVTSDQFATMSALATKLEAAAGCTSQAALHPKVLKAPTVTTTPTTVAPAPTPKKDTTAKTTQSESRSTEGRKPR